MSTALAAGSAPGAFSSAAADPRAPRTAAKASTPTVAEKIWRFIGALLDFSFPGHRQVSAIYLGSRARLYFVLKQTSVILSLEVLVAVQSRAKAAVRD